MHRTCILYTAVMIFSVGEPQGRMKRKYEKPYLGSRTSEIPGSEDPRHVATPQNLILRLPSRRTRPRQQPLFLLPYITIGHS